MSRLYRRTEFLNLLLGRRTIPTRLPSGFSRPLSLVDGLQAALNLARNEVVGSEKWGFGRVLASLGRKLRGTVPDLIRGVRVSAQIYFFSRRPDRTFGQANSLRFLDAEDVGILGERGFLGTSLVTRLLRRIPHACARLRRPCCD
jgi:hypothetical protein